MAFRVTTVRPGEVAIGIWATASGFAATRADQDLRVSPDRAVTGNTLDELLKWLAAHPRHFG